MASLPLLTAIALNPGANQDTGPTYSAKVCFNGSWQNNYYCQQRQVDRANERSISFDVYACYQMQHSLSVYI